MAMIAMVLILHGGMDTLSLRLGTVAQDILLFMFPAIAVGAVVSADAGRLLCVNRLPSSAMTVLAILVLVCSIPVMNRIVAWNEAMSLPQSLEWLETWMRQTENAAQEQVALLLGGTSVGDLIVSLLIVGVMAGVSEEFFFRGAMQRVLSSGSVNPHLAIWITAIIFSLFHVQFYGFFPRLLLGAFFGYLLYWSGSIWLPALVHALNNSIVVCTSWADRVSGGETPSDVNTFGVDSVALITLSLLLTAGIIWTMSKLEKR